MTFTRNPAPSWQRDIPGARWFKADLHVHTIDDHHGGRAKLPDGLSGDPSDPEVMRRYARRFLEAAVARGVQVIGLTPHSPRAGTGPEHSAAWAIVDEWNEGEHEGVPFREKIFAVFPGFEPNINVGSKGVHLLFLFDPEIGRDRYLALYDAVMDGREPWQHSALHPTDKDAIEVFHTLDQRQSDSSQSEAPWGFIALAPHIEREHGVLREIGSRVLERFPCHRLSGYELGDQKLPADFDKARNPGRFLLPAMEEHRQAFFHASDAYSIENVGQRHTWLKLGTPRTEALRQAFVASESRLRIAYEREPGGSLRRRHDGLDVMLSQRPWLKEVTVSGAGSFFGSRKGPGAGFRLSPDLTCIIGGSMTGKSTFLDGLRVYAKAPLPSDEFVRRQVQARGGEVFAAGSPEVRFECPGTDPTAPLLDRWPALFFAQNELQRLSQESSAVEDILTKLVGSETPEIEGHGARIKGLDTELRRMATRLIELDQDLAEAEQARERAGAAKRELDAFAEVGVNGLHLAARDERRFRDFAGAAQEMETDAGQLSKRLREAQPPGAPGDDQFSQTAINLENRRADIVEQSHRLAAELGDLARDAAELAELAHNHHEKVHASVVRALAERGLDTAKLREFQEIHRQASLLPSYDAHLEATQSSLTALEQAFAKTRAEREGLIRQQRELLDHVMAQVESIFGGRIRPQRVDGGDSNPLSNFLGGLKQRGITRWWNELADEDKPSPQALIESLGRKDQYAFRGLGMSRAVEATFRESLDGASRRRLAALRCPDRYRLELRLDGGSYRRLDELSGGQRVSVLLSLLLETDDNRPLIIDQPEDELDSRFLLETVLPALKRLKGRRQIVVATHDANIVVNGDADLVIQLEATATQGRVAQSGAIEEPDVRAAIVRTVDGGQEAFRLRRQKYGF